LVLASALEYWLVLGSALVLEYWSALVLVYM
jgi:hypothetical protein